MSVVLINDSTLTDIADAIREQNGTQTTYLPSDMPAAIAAIEGGGGGIPDITITTGSNKKFASELTNQLFDVVKNKITITPPSNYQNWYSQFFMNFEGEDLSSITIPLRYSQNSDYELAVESLFQNCFRLKKLPSISHVDGTTVANPYRVGRTYSMFSNCQVLEEIPNSFWEGLFNPVTLEGLHSNTASFPPLFDMFYACYSLKELPDISQMYSLSVNSLDRASFPSFAANCYELRKILNHPLIPIQRTTNMYSGTTFYLSKCSDLTFVCGENNQPLTRSYANQTLTIGGTVGQALSNGYVKDQRYQVTNAATYESYKNEDGWWTMLPEYSKYNHDSAVRTINSLPDTSAFLQTNGGTNTIKFENATNKGSATDGGAIADLTAAEIAVATAKGWTVVLA